MSRRPTEPSRMGATVRDRSGDLWRRGRTRWTCMAPVDGVRVQRVARLPWYALVDQYGPVEVVDLNDPVKGDTVPVTETAHDGRGSPRA